MINKTLNEMTLLDKKTTTLFVQTSSYIRQKLITTTATTALLQLRVHSVDADY